MRTELTFRCGVLSAARLAGSVDDGAPAGAGVPVISTLWPTWLLRSAADPSSAYALAMLADGMEPVVPVVPVAVEGASDFITLVNLKAGAVGEFAADMVSGCKHPVTVIVSFAAPAAVEPLWADIPAVVRHATVATIHTFRLMCTSTIRLCKRNTPLLLMSPLLNATCGWCLVR